MAKRTVRGPQFVQYFAPVITALKGLGGSGRPAEVRDAIAELLTISEDDQTITMQSSESRFSNQVAGVRAKAAQSL